jgi:hypothetical protein
MGIEEPIIDHTCCNTRSLAAKLSDIISVKDFGAKGDGVADDTQAIKDAITYACGKSLLFPHGTYLLKTQDLFGRQVFVELTDDIKIIGHNATLKCAISGNCNTNTAGQTTPCTAGAMMELYSETNNNVHISGLNFNGDNKAVTGLVCREGGIRQANVKIENCSFINMFSPRPWVDTSSNTTDDWPTSGSDRGGVAGFREATGLLLYGAWANVVVDGCFVKNISRAATAGLPLFFGSCGITVTAFNYSGGIFIPPKSTTITNCHIENILNNESLNSSLNVDCDGLKVFGSAGTGESSNYTDTSAAIYGNHFVNCKGRDIKIQIEEVTIQNNTSYMNTPPMQSGGARINVQITSGIVSNNVFQFDLTSTGTSSFVSTADTGGTVGQGCVISFYDGDLDNRARTVNIENNHVYLNVPPSIGRFRRFVDFTATGSKCNASCCEGVGGQPSGCTAPATPAPGCTCQNVWNQPGFITVRGNKIVGQGRMVFFAEIGTRVANSVMYYTFEDNMVSNLETAFLTSNGNGAYDNVKISAINNINAGSPVKHFVASWDSAATPPPSPFRLYSANISALNNKNIGLKDNDTSNPTNPLGTNEPRTFTPKFRYIGNPDFSSGLGGGIAIQTVRPAANTVQTFSSGDSPSAGKIHIFLSNAVTNNVVVFRSGISTIVPIFASSGVTVSGDTTEPSGSVKLWSNGDGSINMKTTSSSTNYTLFTFG